MGAFAARRRRLSCSLFITLLSHTLLIAVANTRAPGQVYTDSGYDNLDGKDAICWIAPAYHNHSLVTQVLSENNLSHTHTSDYDDSAQGTNWKSALHPSFVAGPTKMLSSCPDGTSLLMTLTHETVSGSDLYRTHYSYTYHVHASVDLAVIRQDYNLTDTAFFESEDGSHEVAIRIIFCPVTGDFCSPYLAERINDTESLGSTIEHNHDRELFMLFSRGLQYNEEQTQHLNELASNNFLISVKNINQTVVDFDIDIDIEVHDSGNYIPLASIQFFLSNDTIHGHDPGIDESVAFKVDMANLLPTRSIHFYDPLIIQSVSSGVEIFTYVIVAVAALIQLALLGCSIYYRNESVMTLSQGGFLVALQVAGLTATTCSILYNPVSDAYCLLQSPMTMIPLQFMFAVVFGRLLRILTIMAPLLDWHSGNNKREMRHRLRTWKNNFMSGRAGSSQQSTSRSSGVDSSGVEISVEGSEPQARNGREHTLRNKLAQRLHLERRHSLRQKFSRRRLCIIILLVTFPMVIVEIVGLAVFTPEQTVSINAAESAGRYECGDDAYHIYQISSTAVIVITMFADLYLAQKSRKLPALFNEVESVTSALVVSLFVAILCFAVVIVVEDPEASPSIPYFMEVVIIVNAALNLSVRLVLPKLRLIWKGEKVVISRVLAEHRKTGSVTSSRIQTDAPTWVPPTTVGAIRRTSGVSEVSHLDAFESATTVEETGNEDLETAVSKRNIPLIESESKDEELVGQGIEGESKEINATKVATVATYEKPEEEDSAAVVDTTGEASSDHSNDGLSNGKAIPHRRRISFSLPDASKEKLPSTDKHTSAKHGKANRRKSTVIVEGHAPPSNLVTELLSHSEKVSEARERILSGLQVSREAWEDIRTSLNDLSLLLENVEYK